MFKHKAKIAAGVAAIVLALGLTTREASAQDTTQAAQDTSAYAPTGRDTGAMATDTTAAARDTTDTTQGAAARTDTTTDKKAHHKRKRGDTTAVQNPPGYRGMERDTTQVPGGERTGVDSVLLKEGTGQMDTAGYSGAERWGKADTLKQQGDTADTAAQDTTGR